MTRTTGGSLLGLAFGAGVLPYLLPSEEPSIPTLLRVLIIVIAATGGTMLLHWPTKEK